MVTIGQKIFEEDSNTAILTIVPYIDPITRGQSYIGTSGGSLNEFEKTNEFTNYDELKVIGIGILILSIIFALTIH